MKPSTQNPEFDEEGYGTLKISLHYAVANGENDEIQARVEGGLIRFLKDPDDEGEPTPLRDGRTDSDGCVAVRLPAGEYLLELPGTGGAGKWLPGKEISATEVKDKRRPLGNHEGGHGRRTTVAAGGTTSLTFYVPKEDSGLAFNSQIQPRDGGTPVNSSNLTRGRPGQLSLEHLQLTGARLIELFLNDSVLYRQVGGAETLTDVALDTTRLPVGRSRAAFAIHRNDGTKITGTIAVDANDDIQYVGGHLKTTTSLTRTETAFTEDTALWMAILNSTEALSFNSYLRYMDWIFCGGEAPPKHSPDARHFDAKLHRYKELLSKRFLPFTDADSYRVVKAATEAFVMVNCGVRQDTGHLDGSRHLHNRDEAYLDRRDLPIPEHGLHQVFDRYLVPVNGAKTLPYLAVIRRKLPDIPIKTSAFEDSFPSDPEIDNCFGLIQQKLTNPCLLELIWSYWNEEGMLVQTINAISRRFQNVHSPLGRDPLANLEIDPLRPLNTLFWDYLQDEQHRLSVIRRNYEYDHHYGLRLEGRAVRDFRPADSRSRFLEAFHQLLRVCTVFFKQDDDTTVKADAFPVLNALKEVHLVLSQGAHNQFGDLPSTARIEMLIQQWLLARPEFREFLPTRIMVAYPEPWMDRVDAMKKIQGWTDTSVLHFRNLAIFGEQLLLSIRWGHWSDVYEAIQAFNWARFFRPQVQGYIHAFGAATGSDVTADPTVDARVDATLPSVLLKRRLATQQRAR